MAGVSDDSNGVYVEMNGKEEKKETYSADKIGTFDEEITLFTIFNRLITAIAFPKSDRTYASDPMFQRIKIYFYQNVPLLREAFKNTANHVLLWTRRGSPFRALFVVSVGTVALLALTGLLVFMLFFVAATINAIVISLLMSLAAAGGFLAIFFVCVTAIYVGALSVAVFVISATTISAIIAALIASGWIGFFFMIWLASKKAVEMAKHVFNFTGSTLTAYSSGRFVQHHHESNK